MQHIAQGDAKQRQETRAYVTPYKFSVSENMLGTALATPARRAVALLVDLCLVALLTNVSSTFLAVFVAVVFFKAASQPQSHTLRRTRKILRFAGAVTIAVLVFDVSERTVDYLGLGQPYTEAPESVEKAEQNTQTEELGATASKEEYQSVTGLLEALTGIVKDFGMGLGWAALYFTVLTAWFGGQTPGKKALGVKVVKLDGQSLNLWESFGRYGGYGAGLATGLMGFLQVCWDPNRQAIQDKISETLVIDTRKPRKQWDVNV